jgi:hypothetical protein
MGGHLLSMDINALFPLILLVAFLVLPSILKLLGQYTLNSKNADRRLEQEPENLPVENAHEDMERSLQQHDFETVQKESFAGKPINPKWF